MCGIVGVINFNNASIDPTLIKKMTDTIRHRGPDGEGIWLNEKKNIGLGHRRLAIIDLSENANQPMMCNRTGNVIVFNGEIYNFMELKNNLMKIGYSFSTNSDTEVLLALYDYKKEDCLKELNGMFAFAIWDEKNKKMFCARDRFGEKPFYFFYDNEQFVFASEMKAIWAYGIKRELNNDFIEDYVINGNVSFKNGVSFYKNISLLPSSNYMIIDIINKKISYFKYYEVVFNQKNNKIKFNEAVVQFYHLLSDSVKLRLRSDVSVGSSLSGGIDSSSIVYLINKTTDINHKQYTFSARFNDFVNDEGVYIDKMINSFPNIIGKSVWPNEVELLNDISQLIYHHEEPVTSASVYAQWCVMRLAKENDITVLLDGQGADEILGGYVSCVNYFFKEMIFRNYFKYLKEYNLYHNMQSSSKWRIPSIEKNETFRMKLGRWKISLTRNYNKIPYSFDEHLKYLTTTNENLGTLLRYADRNSMAHSREVRLPFLDHRIVDFIFSLPIDFKFNSGWTKYILRKSFENKLPDDIVWRKLKIGYEPPQIKWLKYPEIQSIINNQKKILGLKSRNNVECSDYELWRLFISYFYFN
jgi:asparagine synthase (glutamine-hydrolysing)